jgi:hypothetical protein
MSTGRADIEQSQAPAGPMPSRNKLSLARTSRAAMTL